MNRELFYWEAFQMNHNIHFLLWLDSSFVGHCLLVHGPCLLVITPSAVTCMTNSTSVKSLKVFPSCVQETKASMKLVVLIEIWINDFCFFFSRKSQVSITEVSCVCSNQCSETLVGHPSCLWFQHYLRRFDFFSIKLIVKEVFRLSKMFWHLYLLTEMFIITWNDLFFCNKLWKSDIQHRLYRCWKVDENRGYSDEDRKWTWTVKKKQKTATDCGKVRVLPP